MMQWFVGIVAQQQHKNTVKLIRNSHGNYQSVHKPQTIIITQKPMLSGFCPTPISDELMIMSQDTPTGNDALAMMLQNLLQGRQPTDIQLQQLSDVQFAMYMKIKEKKVSAPMKRPDELQKMFFKRAIKYAEGIFMKRKKVKRISMFYRHHFLQVAKSLGCSLMNFYHPNREVKSGKKTGQKTFNATYVRLVLRSKSFREVTRSYLGVFLQQNQKERKQKIKKLLQVCRRIAECQPTPTVQFVQRDAIKLPEELRFSDIGEVGWTVTDEVCHKSFQNKGIPPKVKWHHQWDQLQQYLQSSKCKIPWSNMQLQEAMRLAELEINASQSMDE